MQNGIYKSGYRVRYVPEYVMFKVRSDESHIMKYINWICEKKKEMETMNEWMNENQMENEYEEKLHDFK